MMLTRTAKEKRLPLGLENPDDLARKTMEMADRGEGLYHAGDLQDMLAQLRS